MQISGAIQQTAEMYIHAEQYINASPYSCWMLFEAVINYKSYWLYLCFVFGLSKGQECLTKNILLHTEPKMYKTSGSIFCIIRFSWALFVLQ